MKFIAENMKKLSQRNKEKNIKKNIRRIKNKIKLKAKDGENICIAGFYEDFSDIQQAIIIDYFIKRNFEVEWSSNNRIVVRWAN